MFKDPPRMPCKTNNKGLLMDNYLLQSLRHCLQKSYSTKRRRLSETLARFPPLAGKTSQRHSPTLMNKIKKMEARCCQWCSHRRIDRWMNRWTATTTRSDNKRLKFINPLNKYMPLIVIFCLFPSFLACSWIHAYTFACIYTSTYLSIFLSIILSANVCVFWSFRVTCYCSMIWYLVDAFSGLLCWCKKQPRQRLWTIVQLFRNKNVKMPQALPLVCPSGQTCQLGSTTFQAPEIRPKAPEAVWRPSEELP